MGGWRRVFTRWQEDGLVTAPQEDRLGNYDGKPLSQGGRGLRGNRVVGFYGRPAIATPMFVEELRMRRGVDGNSPPMLHVINHLYILSRSKKPVVLLGERGVGKKKLAALLHHIVTSSDFGCMTISCEKLVLEELSTLDLETYLCNREAFSKKTLILDRVELLPRSFCHAMLAILVRRGSVTQMRPVIIVESRSASKFFAGMDGQMRATLQEGLIRVPPLQERRGDVREHILQKVRELNSANGKAKYITRSTLDRLSSLQYPRNFHSLNELLERMYAVDGEVVNYDESLVNGLLREHDDDCVLPDLKEGFTLEKFLNDLRERIVWQAMQMSGGDHDHCAKILGVPLRALTNYLHSKGIELS
jgi:DNA-binding NtrC family response regulator